MVGQTKIENFMDNIHFFFPFVSNKLIFILLIAILYFQIYKHYKSDAPNGTLALKTIR